MLTSDPLGKGIHIEIPVKEVSKISLNGSDEIKGA